MPQCSEYLDYHVLRVIDSVRLEVSLETWEPESLRHHLSPTGNNILFGVKKQVIQKSIRSSRPSKHSNHRQSSTALKLGNGDSPLNVVNTVYSCFCRDPWFEM